MKNKYSLYTIYTIIAVNIVVVVAIIISAYASYSYTQTKNKIFDEMKYSSALTMTSLKKNVVNYIESYSPSSYEILIVNEMDRKDILSIVIEDYNMGKILGESAYITGKIRDNNTKSVVDYDLNNIIYNKSLEECFYTNSSMIYSLSGDLIGKITIYNTDYYMKKELENIIISNIINSIVISLVLIVILILTIDFLVIKPLSNIINVIQDVDNDGIPKKEIPKYGSKEIQVLVSTMNNMIQTIKHERIELEESEQRYSSLLDAMQELVFIKDSKLKYIMTNKALEDFFGLSKEQLLGKNDYDLMDEESAKSCATSDEMVIRHHRLAVSQEQIGDKIFETHKFPVKINEKELGLGCYVVDITTKKLQEQAILEAKEKLEITLEAVNIGIWEWDILSGKAIWDKNCYELLGYKHNAFEVTYDVWKSLQYPDDVEKSHASIQSQLKSGNHYTIEFRLKKVDGSWIWIESRGKTVLSDEQGNSLKMVGTHMDITSIKEYEKSLEQEVALKTKELNELNLNLENRVLEEVEKNRQKDILLQQQTRLAAIGEMIGNIAHQWRQPLSAITAVISGLKLKEEYKILGETDIKEANDSIMKNAQFLSTTIENFRNFFKKDISKREFLVSEAINDTLSIVKASYENHFINVKFDMDEKVSYFGSDSLLSQVLLNLLSNAKDALLQNNITTKIVTISLYEDNLNIYISIKDNAGGVLDNIKDKIFDPYFTTKHQSQGTGLGLYMSNQIVQNHFNGTLTVSNIEDEDGKGALFIITIPKINKLD
ncbi:sensor histidine kinase [Arcobacter sp. FWKO B]|uniref:PAS domain-containing sensor histidine kinase n=1 Tax=Arcobacter sp. FWKO B TaxID=2593672 RepID=UPI001903E8D7|nr:HAMP domain-containing sensor histidine kinase [Arcobacter sp. FWKO B]